MIKKKLNGYTILEMAITMLIASVLIGITYTAYSIISKSFISYNKQNEDMAVLVQLDHLLKKDLSQADIIVKNTEGVSFSSTLHRVNYVFTPAFIIRSEIRTDTFKVHTDSLVTMFEQQPLIDISETPEQNRIDDIGFVLLFNDQKIPYHYHKQYSSVNLINRNANAFN